MFYQGDLQSGITSAVEQSKLVTCFVTDDKEESATWENEFLQEPDLIPLLLERSLLLRLQAGSQEAGFLAAIYPIPRTPTLVIIHNGQLKEYLTTGVSKSDFLRRVKAALDDGREVSTTAPSESIPVSAAQSDSDQPEASTSSRNAALSEVELSPAAGDVTAGPSTRINTQKEEQDVTEASEKATKAKAPSGAPQSAASDPEVSKRAADMKYALMQKKRQADARNERARILKRVEDDKAERRREALRKEQARAAVEPTDSQPATPEQALSSHIQRSLQRQGSDCVLQVRLFDGTMIRSRFPGEKTLRADVRPWVESARTDGDTPYTFKQILTPHPNRTITISEEEESLDALNLNPGATLVLVPVKDYTSAYVGGPTSYISKWSVGRAGLVSSAINGITGIVGNFLGGNTNLATEVEHENRSSPTSVAANVRNVQESGVNQEEHQLYNGNSLNFEPRRDDDDEEN